KWGKDDPDIEKQFGLWYRYFWVFLEDGKLKKLLAHPVLTGGMYFLRVMVGINYILEKIVK
ncbi:MAG: glycosyltransferase family 2 protein, partial [Candidatus Pacebacteria bacterium]|nr:glycosyltransferase family 2 protein [Candidatus Paceibacterota bacterium]